MLMGRFKSDKQRKAVMAKLRGGTKSPVTPIILPLQLISGDVIKKGFRTNAPAYPLNSGSTSNKRRAGLGRGTAFSYVTGRKLPGRFNSIKDVFKKFPKEKKAFDAVKRFNKKFNTRIKSTNQLKIAEQRIEKFRKKDNPPRKSKRKVKRFAQSIYG